MDTQTKDLTILTGDRPTGPLHLGHLVGSLEARVRLQHQHRQFVLIADAQALTDNVADPGKIGRNILELMADYLAVGIEPDKTVWVARGVGKIKETGGQTEELASFSIP